MVGERRSDGDARARREREDERQRDRPADQREKLQSLFTRKLSGVTATIAIACAATSRDVPHLDQQREDAEADEERAGAHEQEARGLVARAPVATARKVQWRFQRKLFDDGDEERQRRGSW